MVFNPFEPDGKDENLAKASQEQDVKLEQDRINWKLDNVANVIGYDSTGAYRYASVDGTKTKIYTKYLTGTLDADTATSVAHGIADYDKILQVTAHCKESTVSAYAVYDYLGGVSANGQYTLYFDATNIQFINVGSNSQGQVYRIKIEYYL